VCSLVTEVERIVASALFRRRPHWHHRSGLATMVSEAGGGANVLGRTYLVMYTDGRGQAQTERGSLVALDQEGFVVLEVHGKYVLIPKARIDALVEVE
jgi:hypothetical protein